MVLGDNKSSKVLWKKFRELDIYSKRENYILPTQFDQPHLINNFFLEQNGIKRDSDLGM